MSSVSSSTSFKEPCDYLSLTNENWEWIVKDVFVEDFRKLKTEIKTILLELIQLNNELKVICHQLSATKTTFQKDIDILEKKLELCKKCQPAEFQDNIVLEQMIGQIEEKNVSMSAEIDKFEKERDSKITNIREQMATLASLKEKLAKQNTERTDALKRFKVQTKKMAIIESVQRKIESLDHHFKIEVRCIAQYESKLKYLFQFIRKMEKDGSSCDTTSSSSQDGDVRDFLHAQCYEQQRLRLETLNYIKTNLGDALIQALSAMTIHQPADPIEFIANHLMFYRHNDLKLQQREENLQNLLEQRSKCFKKIEDV